MVGVTVDSRPTLDGVLGATFAVLTAAAILATADVRAAIPAVVALPCLLLAGVHGSKRALAIGVLALLLALIVGALTSASPAVLLVAGVLVVTAWALVDHAMSLGRHVGRAAETRRSELVHGGSILLVGVLFVGIVLIGMATIPSGWPVSAVIFALLAGFFALLAVESRS